MNALTRIIIIRFLCAFLEVIRQVDADIVALLLTLRASRVESPDGADGRLNTPSYVTNEDSNGSCQGCKSKSRNIIKIYNVPIAYASAGQSLTDADIGVHWSGASAAM